jgi:hypothetical protein
MNPLGEEYNNLRPSTDEGAVSSRQWFVFRLLADDQLPKEGMYSIEECVISAFVLMDWRE